MNRTKGFTIIELTIIVLILGVFAFAAMHKSPVPQINAAQAAYKIKFDIRYAQAFALATQKRARVSFDTAAEGYSVYYENLPGSWTLLKEPSRQKDFIVSLAARGYRGIDIVQTNFGGINFDLVFDAAGRPYGYSPAAGTAALLSSPGSVTLNQGLVITVEPQTGRVSIA